VAWIWDPEEKLGERALALVAALRNGKQKTGLEKNASRPLAVSDDSRSSIVPYDPCKITFELLSKSSYLEDLAEFKRRIDLFRQFVRN